MKLKIATLAFAGAIAISSVLPAFAAPGDTGSGLGGCIDNIYGNATNPRPSGNGVLPSQSPGPWVNTGFNDPPRNDRTLGISIGGIMQIGHSLGANGQQVFDFICN